ncbi:unnamed protein product [Soboliphyme baturini]|uniref:ZP domain-containing protein n=1 Tax=Soboliphyme baturini TaxID=241478 RepID=A0A183J4C5_9BILA|nr:unnamed protein product [Soboliphyme baturini]
MCETRQICIDSTSRVRLTSNVYKFGDSFRRLIVQCHVTYAAELNRIVTMHQGCRDEPWPLLPQRDQTCDSFRALALRATANDALVPKIESSDYRLKQEPPICG